jgi:acyl transferase domain-containing protein/acyl-CoA synthetase (AMP-forming)/AMP-acid ligase II/acyl carrier protein
MDNFTDSLTNFHPATLVELLRHQADKHKEQTLYNFLLDGERQEVSVSYAGLDTQAKAIAVTLREMAIPGDRVLLLYAPSLDYIAAYFGCLYAGMVAVPVYPPDPGRLKVSLERLQNIVADAQAKIALSTASVLAMLNKIGMGNTPKRPSLLGKIRTTFLKRLGLPPMPGLQQLVWLASDKIALQRAAAWQAPAISHDTLAFLQYTSGSTGFPKGVMLSHANLMSNLYRIHLCFETSDTSRGVFWLPFYHDMGLIGGVLETVYCGATSTLMSPVSFLQKPLRWLTAISRSKGTISGAPNFAYELCVRKVKPEERRQLDLSSWTLAFNGAEPIHSATIEQFSQYFAPCGFRREAFYPCYGLAEATLIVSGGKKMTPPVFLSIAKQEHERGRVVPVSSDSPQAVSLVGCGKAVADQQVVIADPVSCKQCAAETIGEIWVSGPSVAQGYWRKPELTREIFAARLAEKGEGPFLRTGDLGFLLQDQLFISGRIKDMIILHGRNYYPQDLEFSVESSHSSLRPGCAAAFSVEVADSERLIVVQEVRAGCRKSDLDDMLQKIRQAIARDHGIEAFAVSLIKDRTIPKTSSGKIQRSATRQAFLDGTLQVVKAWQQEEAVAELPPQRPDVAADEEIPQATPAATAAGHKAEQISEWLVQQLAQKTGIAARDISVREPFVYYGLGSLALVEFANMIEQRYARQLSPTAMWDYPNIEKLAHYLAQGADSKMPGEVEETSRAEREPIAVVGIGCRLPGGVCDAASFWQLLRSGNDAIVVVPDSRWDAQKFYDPDIAKAGKMNTRWGGFISDVDLFDADFFSIAPREASRMDPQQRILLEISWEALEDAGLVAEKLRNTATGVFLGISHSDYGRLEARDIAQVDGYMNTGAALSIAANRISYFFDFRGPSLAIDTACSSSLVAVHLACRSLWQHESTLALAGGSNLLLDPGITVSFTKLGAMSPDGRSKTFDASANGYVRGEGACMVVLKPLSKAVRDGDRVYAVILGSAVNQDGRSNGLTAPNGKAQEALLRQAFKDAGVTSDQLGYIEAHGTGTSLGDPIEVNALGNALADRDAQKPKCPIGSVKTNIGHLEAAAGIAGLIKVALSLHHAERFPSLHFHQPNPLIPFARLSLQVQATLETWPEAVRIAGVSSFGFGGTNAHIVLQSVPVPAKPDAANAEPPYVLPLSAQQSQAIPLVAKKYAEFLARQSDISLSDLCYNAALRRSHLTHRAAIVFATREQLQERLQILARGEPHYAVARGREQGKRPKIVFVCSGQGQQWWAMARALLGKEGVFRASVEECDRLLRPYTQWSLCQELLRDEKKSRVEETEVAQAAIFAVEVALAALLRSWQIVPDAVVGHSIGEVAAAHIAGILSLADAIRIVHHRGRLMQKATGLGKMAEVALPYQDVAARVAGYQDRLCIAAVNSPAATVVSGDAAALAEFTQNLAAQQVAVRPLPVVYAFHSQQMEPYCAELTSAIGTLTLLPSCLAVFSTVRGDSAQAGDFDAAYWAKNIREPVLFYQAIQKMVAGYDIFVELSAHAVLVRSLREILDAGGAQNSAVITTLRRNKEDMQCLKETVAALYAQGYPVHWPSFYAGGSVLHLPSYPWQHKKLWFQPKSEERQPAADAPSCRIKWRDGDNRCAGSGIADVEIVDAGGKVMFTIEAAHLQRPRLPLDSLVRSRLYEIFWQQQPLDQTAAVADSSRHWLIFADDKGWADNLQKILQARGVGYSLVTPGTAYAAESDRFTVTPSNPDHFRQMVKQLGLHHERLCILHLWSLNLEEVEGVLAAQHLTCGSALSLVQALALEERLVQSELFLLTRGARSLGSANEIVLPVQSPLWGLCQVIAGEHPRLRCVCMDLEYAPLKARSGNAGYEGEANDVLMEIAHGGSEKQVAWRRHTRYVARLVRQTPGETHRTPVIRADATYLITGGLGALGLVVAHEMARRGARHLVLLGRRGLTPEATQAVKELGDDVKVMSGDVADGVRMREIFQELASSMPPLKGIIHTAGVVDDGLLLQQTWQRLHQVMSPKIQGAWNLHCLSEGISLDFFVMFSSVASIINSPCQGGYAAGNAFLDALAHYRHALSLPATVVNWGPWQETGMTARMNTKVKEEWQAAGVESMLPEEGSDLLHYLLPGTIPQTIVFAVDWRRFLAQFAGQVPPFYARLAAEREQEMPVEKPLATQGQIATRQELWQRLQQMTAGESREMAITHMQQAVCKILQRGEGDVPARTQSFTAMGMDSLMALELKAALEDETGLELSTAVLLQYQNIETMCDYLLEQLAAKKA